MCSTKANTRKAMEKSLLSEDGVKWHMMSMNPERMNELYIIIVRRKATPFGLKNPSVNVSGDKNCGKHSIARRGKQILKMGSIRKIVVL